MNIELLTKDATLDDLSTGEYHELFEEIRYDSTLDKFLSFDKFIEHIHSVYSKALWAKFSSGEIAPNRGMRNELRAARGLPLLPPTVAEVTATASPDSEVTKIGQGTPDRIVMIEYTEPVTIQVNDSSVEIVENQPSKVVTSVTTKRKPMVRPVVSIEADSRRAAIGAKWADVIEAGLKALENIQVSIGDTNQA